MVETSGSARLDPRQACSVEAAALRSGLGVVVVMTGGRLDLTDNTTCCLTKSHLNIQFFTVNLASLGRQTALGQHQLLSLDQSECSSVSLQKRSSAPLISSVR